MQETLHAGAQAREDGFAAQRLVATSSCVPLVGAHENRSLMSFPTTHHTYVGPPCRLLKLVMFISKRRDDAIIE